MKKYSGLPSEKSVNPKREILSCDGPKMFYKFHEVDKISSFKIEYQVSKCNIKFQKLFPLSILNYSLLVFEFKRIHSKSKNLNTKFKSLKFALFCNYAD